MCARTPWRNVELLATVAHGRQQVFNLMDSALQDQHSVANTCDSGQKSVSQKCQQQFKQGNEESRLQQTQALTGIAVICYTLL